MFSQEILEQIHRGEITTRSQLWKVVGRTKKRREWLDTQGILLPPKRQTKAEVVGELRAYEKTHNELPKYDTIGIRTAMNAQHHFGTWNNALYFVFGDFNQRRYVEYSDEQLLELIRQFVRETKRIPLRQEFDGKKYPYYETYITRFNVRTWAEVLAKVKLDDLPHYAKHGWGKKYYYKGVTYLSHQEYLIGKYLTDRGIPFEKEVPYGFGTNFFFDFYLTTYNVYVEYYGIATKAYKETCKEKQKEYRGRRVIEIFKHENTIKKLHSEVQRL